MIAIARLCSAGRDHAALKLDDRSWNELAPDGIQQVEACGDEPAEELELRRCPCGSTLGRIRKPAKVLANS